MMRVKDHPILGPLKDEAEITISFEGKHLKARPGEPIAAVLYAAGIKVFRYTKRFNEPRSLFCGIGRCTDCMMIVNGVTNVRTCITIVEDGMVVERQKGLGYWSDTNEAD
ncbi:(2Fe-2S)-binding protein [Metallumcola ferriviriculae]|uniref:(2Fe-2S)-binding protein n=1 Tax=Metallumcola ferriviriculae TaxID=3039180 RepID=A0AAU0USN0_9FIRM|nr:(2Fe-2S)-binding protein [Desulfitibacteraceae bacterium MK1]